MVAFSKRFPERAGEGESLESAEPLTGQQLLAEFVRYDHQSPFEEIVRRYAGMVYSTCSRITKNRQDAEDATQAVFLTLALQVKKGTEIKALGPWLQQVAKRLSLDTRRGGKRRKTREETHQREQIWRAECSEPSLPPADLDEVKAVLHEELNKLPSKYRMPLVLHYFGGMSREEMAAELNCNPSTLGVRIFRARAILAERLNGRGINFTPAMLPVLLHQLVKHTISHAVISATTRAAAAAAMGHNVAGMVSHRVILLTRRAATAALLGKLKLAALGVVITCTLLAAGARALSTVPNLGFRDFIDRQVQSLVRPLLQPFSIPLRVSLNRRPGDGFRPMVVNSTLQSVAVAAPAASSATGWRFGPIVPPALVGDDADLVSALDAAPRVPDLFATIGGGGGDTTDPAVAMASEDTSVTATLVGPRDEVGGFGGGGGAVLDLPASADDATDVSTAVAGGSVGAGVDFTFHAPGSASGSVGSGSISDLAVSGVNADRAAASTAARAAAARSGTRQGGGSSTSDSTGSSANGSDPGCPPAGAPPAGSTGSTRGSGTTSTAKTRRPSQLRPGVRHRGNSPWDIAGPGPTPTGILAMRMELRMEMSSIGELRPPMPLRNGLTCMPLPPLPVGLLGTESGRLMTKAAAQFEPNPDETPIWSPTDPSLVFADVSAESIPMSAQPAVEVAAAPALAVVAPAVPVTPEPSATLLLAAAAGVASTMRRRNLRKH